MKRPETPTLLAALVLSGCTCAKLPGRKATRPPEQAGRYYPADPKELSTSVDRLLAEATAFERPVQAVLVPHAGLEWSGAVSGRVFGALAGTRYRRLVLLGEQHRGRWTGASLPAEGALATPIGRSPVDDEAVSLLEQYDGFERRAVAFDGEYALETLLPFVHRVWPDVPVVPVLVGRTTPGERLALSRALRNVLDEETLLVITSTFTHFGYEDTDEDDPFPLQGTRAELEARLEAYERPHLEAVAHRDPAAFLAALDQAPTRGCGFDALVVGLLALGEGEPGLRLSHASSLDTLYDPAAPEGVSYVGMVFPGRWPAVAELSGDDRLLLSRIAEEGVTAAIHGRDAPELPALTPRLSRPGGAFVTLTQHDQLKGCMGRLEAETLGAAVAQAARMAAASDPRFRPLGPEDLPTLDLEVSVMGPFRTLSDPDDFVPGRHGLLLTSGFSRGLLLPQVATKYRLGREAFLDALSEKAGLACDGWRSARLERFGVDAFHTRPVRPDR